MPSSVSNTMLAAVLLWRKLGSTAALETAGRIPLKETQDCFDASQPLPGQIWSQIVRCGDEFGEGYHWWVTVFGVLLVSQHILCQSKRWKIQIFKRIIVASILVYCSYLVLVFFKGERGAPDQQLSCCLPPHIDTIDDISNLGQLQAWLVGILFLLQSSGAFGTLFYRSWQDEGFSDRVVFSLNILSDNEFKMRTLLDKPIFETYPHEGVVSTVLEAAKEVCDTPKAGHPFLCLQPEANWSILHSLLHVFVVFYHEGRLTLPPVLDMLLKRKTFENRRDKAALLRMRDQLKNTVGSSKVFCFVCPMLVHVNLYLRSVFTILLNAI